MPNIRFFHVSEFTLKKSVNENGERNRVNIDKRKNTKKDKSEKSHTRYDRTDTQYVMIELYKLMLQVLLTGYKIIQNPLLY